MHGLINYAAINEHSLIVRELISGVLCYVKRGFFSFLWLGVVACVEEARKCSEYA